MPFRLLYYYGRGDVISWLHMPIIPIFSEAPTHSKEREREKHIAPKYENVKALPPAPLCKKIFTCNQLLSSAGFAGAKGLQ